MFIIFILKFIVSLLQKIYKWSLILLSVPSPSSNLYISISNPSGHRISNPHLSLA